MLQAILTADRKLLTPDINSATSEGATVDIVSGLTIPFRRQCELRVQSVCAGEFIFAVGQEHKCGELFDREPEWKMPWNVDDIETVWRIRFQADMYSCRFQGA